MASSASSKATGAGKVQQQLTNAAISRRRYSV
jgi:hypothetical protein